MYHNDDGGVKSRPEAIAGRFHGFSCPDGTLALVLPLPDRPKGVRKLEPVRELLLRLPSGEYLPVGEILHYYGFRDGELHFWSADGRHMIYRLASRSLRPGSYGEYLALSEANMAGPGTAFSISYQEGGWRLRWGRKADGAWRCRTLALTVEGVAGK